MQGGCFQIQRRKKKGWNVVLCVGNLFNIILRWANITKPFYQMEDPPMQGLIKNPPKGLKIDPFPTQQTNTKQTLNPPKSLSGSQKRLPCHLEVPTAQRLAPLFVRVLESATKSPSVSNPGIYSLTRWGWGGSLAGHHGKKGLLCLAL
jgi:hypothetical protein